MPPATTGNASKSGKPAPEPRIAFQPYTVTHPVCQHQPVPECSHRHRPNLNPILCSGIPPGQHDSNPNTTKPSHQSGNHQATIPSRAARQPGSLTSPPHLPPSAYLSPPDVTNNNISPAAPSPNPNPNQLETPSLTISMAASPKVTRRQHGPDWRPTRRQTARPPAAPRATRRPI